MEVRRMPQWFRFLFEDYSGQEGSWIKKRSRGLLFLITAQICLLFFIPYISPFAADEHLLGSWGFAVADFFIRTLFGISAFSIPLAFVMLGLHDLYRKPNLSMTLQQIVALGFFLFAFNIALLSTDLIFTPWAGLFPHFFHALIVHYLGQNETNSALSTAFEVLLVFVSLLFVMGSFRWHHKLKMKQVKSFCKKAAVKIKRGVLGFFRLLSFSKNKSEKKEKSESEEKSEGKKFGFNLSFLKKIEKDSLTKDIEEALKKNMVLELDSEKLEKLYRDKKAMENKNAPTVDLSSSPKTSDTPTDIDVRKTAYFLKQQTEAMMQSSSLDGVAADNLGDGSLGLQQNSPTASSSVSQPVSQSVSQSVSLGIDLKEQFFEQSNLKNSKAQEGTDDWSMPKVINKLHDAHGDNFIAASNCLQSFDHLLGDVGEKKEEILKTQKKLVETFADFGITTHVQSVVTGPVITQYQITLEPGVRVQKVVALADNLALALAASSLRIIAPIPGKSLIGVEIPNSNRKMVLLAQIIKRSEHSDQQSINQQNVNQQKAKKKRYNLPIALGVSIVGEPVITDLSKTPHLLVAGATGSGKSVCINGMIASLLLKCSPKEVRFLMVDPKKVELNIYNGIPHLLHPVITDHKEASCALQWIVLEMQARYELLEKNGARNIISYNQKAASHPNTLKTMPYIVVVIDELADLMLNARREVEDSICRLAAMSRAVGIHLILATQRPSVDVITGLIKSNFTSRIAFKVSSKIDSRTIIDCSGAEKLLGRGDMLFQNATENSLQRMQGAFLSDEEVRLIVDDLKRKSQNKVQWIESLLKSTSKIEEPADENFTEDDPLFQAGVDIAIKEGKISASFLQRRLKIGYNRAARMVEMMEEKEIISEADGSKPRRVLISS